MLKDYDTSLKQIYTTTSDNGSNMVKSTEPLREQPQCELDEVMCEETDDELSEHESDGIIPYDDLVSTLGELEHIFQVVINCIRCAHTLQLVILDAIKEADLATRIGKCRKLDMALRKPNNATKLKIMRFKKAKLNISTRWNSNFDRIIGIGGVLYAKSNGCSTESR